MPDTIGEKWAEIRGDLGLGEWRFHDLRHLAAGLVAAAGCDLMVIAAALGHAKPDMSVLYTSISDANRRSSAEKLSSLLGI